MNRDSHSVRLPPGFLVQDDTVEASGSGPSSSKILALFAIGLNLRPDARVVVSHLQFQKVAT